MTIEVCATCQGKGYVKGVACADCGGAGTRVPSAVGTKRPVAPAPAPAPASPPPGA